MVLFSAAAVTCTRKVPSVLIVPANTVSIAPLRWRALAGDGCLVDGALAG